MTSITSAIASLEAKQNQETAEEIAKRILHIRQAIKLNDENRTRLRELEDKGLTIDVTDDNAIRNFLKNTHQYSDPTVNNGPNARWTY